MNQRIGLSIRKKVTTLGARHHRAVGSSTLTPVSQIRNDRIYWKGRNTGTAWSEPATDKFNHLEVARQKAELNGRRVFEIVWDMWFASWGHTVICEAVKHATAWDFFC